MKVVKYLLYILGALLLLAVVAIGIVVATFDPNDYKPQVQRYVKTNYDRDLAIGDIGLKFFPKLGAQLSKVTLSERGGAGEFAGVDKAEVSVALMPLLSRTVVVDGIHVDGLRARLVKRADGTTNFDDLAKGGDTKPAPADTRGEVSRPMRLDVDGIRVTRSQVTWKDEQAKQDLTITLNNLETERLVEDKPSKINLDARVQGPAPKVDAKLAVTGVMTFNLAPQRVVFENLDARVQGSALDFNDLAVQLKGDVNASGADKQLRLSRLSLDAKGTRGADKFDVTLSAPTIESSPQKLRVENLAVNAAGTFGALQLASSSVKAPAVQMDLDKGQVMIQGLAVVAKGRQGGDDLDINLSAPKLDVSRERASGDTALLRAKLSGAARNADVTLKLEGVQGSAQALRIDALTLDVDARMQDTAIKGRLATPVTGDVQGKVYALSKMDGNFTVSNPNFPRKSFSVPVSGTLRAELAKEHVVADLKTRFDESNIAAKAGISGFARPAYDFDVTIDKLNVDQYRTPATSQAKGDKAPAPKGTPPANQPEAPIDLSALKTLIAQGTLKVGRLQANNIKLANLRVDLRARDGKVNVDPLTANLYEGSTKGSIAIDANANRFTVKQAMSAIEIGPLLRDLTDKDVLEGKGSVSVDLRAQGNLVSALKRSLDGTAQVALRDGSVKGVDLAGAVRRVKATLGGGDVEGTAGVQERTDFSELTASFVVKNGVAHNEDLSLKSPFLRVGGAGDVNIVTSSMDYTVKTSVVGTMSGQGGKDLSDLKGLTVPVRVSGPFDQLRYKVDVKQMVRGATKEQLKAAEKAGKEALKETARDKLQELLGGKGAKNAAPADGKPGEAQSDAVPKRKPEDKLKDSIKGLFK